MFEDSYLDTADEYRDDNDLCDFGDDEDLIDADGEHYGMYEDSYLDSHWEDQYECMGGGDY